MGNLNDIKIGDVVRLKSGGPRMTVSEEHIDYLVCVWFVESCFYRERFKVGTLDKL